MPLAPIPTTCGGAYLVLLLSVECLCRVQAPQARARPHQAVLHGGGWNNNTLNVRAPNRNRNAPANRNDNSGLRCAKTPRSAGDEYERIEHIMVMLKAGALPVLTGAL